MASVFLSYDHEDTGRAKPIALALERAGHSVWWDTHVRGGAQFSKVIEEALKAADIVIVLWSQRSIESAWVRDEAAAGRDAGRLVPVTLDGTEPPLGFRQFQSVDLTKWNGRARSILFGRLVDAIENIGPQVPIDSSRAIAADHRSTERRAALRLVVAGLLIAAMLVVGAFVVWRQISDRSAIPTVVVEAADKSAASDDLARDLLAKLGTLQTANADSLRLAEPGEGAGKKPQLRFQIGASKDPGNLAANLVLLSGGDDGLLWSSTVEQKSGSVGDLKQQLALKAARVLECAVEAMAPDARLADRQVLKLYLNTCEDIADIAKEDPHRIASSLLRVVEKAPAFRAAWAKLLWVEADLVWRISSVSMAPAGTIAALRSHIAAARRVDPDMPEAILAEMLLLPPTALSQKIALVDRAKQLSPDNPNVLILRSALMFAVGRMRESIVDAGSARQLDPLSPATHYGFVTTLAYAGRLDAARRELAVADRLWPGTESQRSAHFGLDLRFGDARRAVPYAQREGYKGMLVFLDTRIEPTEENINRLVAFIRSAYKGDPESVGFATQALGQFGREEELYRILDRTNPQSVARASDVLFRPMLGKFREDRRFMQLAARIGLVDYWRKSGHWPDFCYQPDMPYDCKKEAAKMAVPSP